MPQFEAPSSDQSLDNIRAAFDQIAQSGNPDQAFGDGETNFYETDPREKRNFEFFVNKTKVVAKQIGNNRILVAGCGYGLETELLLKQGFEVVGFDFSAEMVELTRQRVSGFSGLENLFVDDVTQINLDRYKGEFASVMLAQVIPAIPIVEDDKLVKKAIRDLSGLTPRGNFYLSNTYYDQPIKEHAGHLHFARKPESIRLMLVNNGFNTIHHEHYDAARDPNNKYNQKNDYFIAEREIQ